MGAFSELLDLLFPPRCVFCRKFLKRGEKSVCPRCEATLPYANGAERHGDFFTVCVSPLYYEGDVRESILRYKFHEATGYAKTYGRLMADCVREKLSGRWDLISWVPLSRERYRERGYDQAMLLALACALELGDVAVSTLEKFKNVEKQSKIGSAEKRRANISGVYRVTDPELITDKRILLIDDIITTGATLSECARTLRDAGAREVLCAAIACGRD